MRDLWYGTSGPPDAKIVFVAEAWGAEEANQKRPLVGMSGVEFDRILDDAGLKRSEVLCTNVVSERPHNNDMWRFFEPRVGNHKPKVGGLLPTQLVCEEVNRLYQQLDAHPRSLVIPMGNYGLWATTKKNGAKSLAKSERGQIPLELRTYVPTGVTTWRSSMLYSEPHNEFGGDKLKRTPVMPIIHPAAILREWYLRAPTVADLKNRVPLALNGLWDWTPYPKFLAPPTFEQAVDVLSGWIKRTDPFDLVCDIETVRNPNLISCIGFADSLRFGMSIPFVKKVGNRLDSYWTPQQEAVIVSLIRKLFRNLAARIVGQNFLFDIQHIQKTFWVTPRLDFDTMLAQNVLFPGTPKGLDYLSSIYCEHHTYWKDDGKYWDLNGTLEQLLLYNCFDLVKTFEIMVTQKQLLTAFGMQKQMLDKMRINDLCLRMMNRGVRIDTARRGELIFELGEFVAKTQTDLLTIIPQERIGTKSKSMWYNSPKQTAYLFYDYLGMKVVRHKKTGEPTVGKEALDTLKKQYPAFKGLFRRLDELGSADNAADVISSQLDSDGRIRCSYGPGGTETHRLNSSKNVFGGGTNLQNLTKGEED